MSYISDDAIASATSLLYYIEIIDKINGTGDAMNE
jgi:hypothetical protein